MPTKTKRKNDTERALAIIGAILSIIFGVLLVAMLPVLIGPLILHGFPLNIIWGILVIVFGVIILTSYGVVNIGPRVGHDWPILIILGVLSLIFGGDIGAIIIIIAGIVGLVRKL
ncbi:MAG: hypothetical protein OdinLCB4_003440 [Candidatus Odinarchaeum yellowstonii]|uniref:Uncharacterized protein n=1 Tax=Odinarchaeota yellowstonii (strain LCB_4) TaxID=1841599 RepID=A0AAF0D3D3_ODILC|nr:MAG: hypothetical protein OdinLCB4_003440 [Candidatus Odinarchaeum yellowstonii]